MFGSVVECVLKSSNEGSEYRGDERLEYLEFALPIRFWYSVDERFGF